MSVTDLQKQIIITDCLTGKIIVSLPYSLLSSSSLQSIVEDVLDEYLDNGFMVKIGTGY